MADYEVPKWAGKPPAGLHLDVYKNDQLIRKVMVDDKSCYFFGRNRDSCQVLVEHSSCSRVHCALLYHKHLNRSFLVDLGSTHGTYLGTMRLEGQKPTPVQVGNTFRLGASTRSFIVREKPKQAADGEGGEEVKEGGFLGVNENVDYDEVTEFNTAHNRRIPAVADMATARMKRKRSSSVRFAEEDTIINPEDIDPSVGRFRNLVQQTVIIDSKKKGGAGNGSSSALSPTSAASIGKRRTSSGSSGEASLYFDIPGVGGASGVLRNMPNSAPAVSMQPVDAVKEMLPQPPPPAVFSSNSEPDMKRKKYAKEAWPGRAPTAKPAAASNLLM